MNFRDRAAAHKMLEICIDTKKVLGHKFVDFGATVTQDILELASISKQFESAPGNM